MSKARELSVVPQQSIGFSPTALLVFTHNITGLKYFCKTTKLNNINSYNGSGVYWKKHINKHGKDISKGVLGIYYNKQECTTAALKFSEENNIIVSKEWANLINENGLDGAPQGEAHPMYGKPSPCIGQKRPHVGKKGKDNPMYGKPSAMRGKKNTGASRALKGRPRPEGGGKPAKQVKRNDGKTYMSISEAAKDIKGTRSGITKCCLNKAKSAHGYQWSYVNV